MAKGQRKIMKKVLLVLALVFTLYHSLAKNPNSTASFTQQNATNAQQITNAFQNKHSDSQVSGSGIVINNLADDTKGSKHQKFILKLSSGQTLLVAHNIDLAPRINTLHNGDTVEFYGEYEWNAKGGVVHWTHRDPDGRHVNGWLKHKGVTYQ